MPRCPACESSDAAERAAIEGHESPPQMFSACTCEEREHSILFVSPERFRMSPQIGTPCRMTWPALCALLARPSIGDAKDEAGAWSPGLYRDNVRRKSELIAIGALVVDVDEGGLVEDLAGVFSRYRTILHETFGSTNDDPRCRAVVELAEVVDAHTYELTHAVVRAHLRAAGIIADEGAKDASRLSYLPVRRAGAGYSFRVLDGIPLDARVVLAAQPKPAPRRPVEPPTVPEQRDRYIAAALRHAAEEVSSASEGIRHYTLSREAFSLARLGLSESEIEAVLLPAFVAAAGERRQSEGIRTIRDAVHARKGAA